jgi:predicted nucleic acid-binding protein
MTVLDTDFLVALLRNDADAMHKLKELEAEGKEARTTVINACELYKGAALAKDPPIERRRVDSFLRNLGQLDLTADLAPAVGEISSGLEVLGTAIGDFDVMIGAITRAAGESLVTRNAKHFERIEGLTVEAW